jgi:hypothetical protein
LTWTPAVESQRRSRDTDTLLTPPLISEPTATAAQGVEMAQSRMVMFSLGCP